MIYGESQMVRGSKEINAYLSTQLVLITQLPPKINKFKHIPSASEKGVSTGHLMSPVNLYVIESEVCIETAWNFSLAIAE